MKLPERVIEALLERWPVARLASVDAMGRPWQVPIVFARAAGQLWSPVDGKPKSGGELARVRNIRARPAASLLLDDYSEDWSRLWWLRVEAIGRVIQPADPERDSALADALARLRAKYPQYARLPLLPDPPTVLVFEVVRTQSWCASRAAIPQGIA